MNMKKILYALMYSLFLVIDSSVAGIADIDIAWKAIALEKNKNAPIEGVSFLFTLSDRSNGKVWDKSCTSNSQGECDMEASVRFEKSGYSKKGPVKWEGNVVTFWLISEAQLQADADELARKARETSELVEQLSHAEMEADLPCDNKIQCDKVFSLAELYMVKKSDMKIQLVTANTIETYNPTEDFKIGLSASRIPGRGESSIISLRVKCKDVEYLDDRNVCLGKRLQVTRGFVAFVSAMLKN
jgi:hypothetical protein